MQISRIHLTLLAVFWIINNAQGQQAFTQKIPISGLDSNQIKAYFKNTIDYIGKSKKDRKEFRKQSENQSPSLFSNMPTFALYGIGNLNTVQQFEELNGSGKLAGYFRLFSSPKSFATAFFSYNRNASNSDSLLASTFLFPDVGQSSFAGTLEWAFLLGTPRRKYTGGRDQINMFFSIPFFEFANKMIKGKANASDTEDLYFSTLMYTFGNRIQFSMHRYEDDASFSLSPYLSFVNIPNEDNNAYRSVFGDEELPSMISSWGIKVVFQYNDFQIFADLKNVMNVSAKDGNERVRAIQGFNSNIGIVFNAQIFAR
ncbi:hypothetical protein [Pollutibacter soli]|uniref:hypothetical protein n=1 Tax=Pollutibacter soli TaxID=3034157 RepID=UPI00301395CE